MLAACVAPAIVRASSLMPGRQIWVPNPSIAIPSSAILSGELFWQELKNINAVDVFAGMEFLAPKFSVTMLSIMEHKKSTARMKEFGFVD